MLKDTKNSYTYSQLFRAAAEKLRTDFQNIIDTNPHNVEKGIEVEEMLKQFLNNYLPKRFKADSGFVLDENNQSSNQCDVIIYDQLQSPVIRHSSRTLILPNDYVASIIEVKSTLNKTQLEDAAEKIKIIKSLKKKEPNETDLPSTGSKLKTYKTLGLVFAFNTDTNLETLTNSLSKINECIDSDFWIDSVIVLNKGVIDLQIKIFGNETISGSLSPSTSKKTIIMPSYIYLTARYLKEYSLNWFWIYLNMHLTHYIYRPNHVNIEQMMEGSINECVLKQLYMMGLDQKLYKCEEIVFNNSKEPIAYLELEANNNFKLGRLYYYKWLQGCILKWQSDITFPPLNDLLKNFLEEPLNKTISISTKPYIEVTTVLNLTLEEFKTWVTKIEEVSNNTLKAQLIINL